LSDLCDAALAYADRGWPVLPLRRHGKAPRLKHGLLDATTEQGPVRAMWTRWPDANIGLLTGVAFDVLDVDGPDGLDALGDRIPENGEALVGATVLTGKGWHTYVAPTGHGNRAGLVDHVDWRGVGGYVVAPPSVHPSGHVYRWAFGECEPIRQAPAWLLELLSPPRVATPVSRSSTGDGYGQRALEAELGRLAVSPVGTRNKDLHLASLRLGQLIAARKLDATYVVEALLAVGRRIGLPEHEIEGTVKSGLRFGMQNPRRSR
jgi:hypothetical protein